MKIIISLSLMLMFSTIGFLGKVMGQDQSFEVTYMRVTATVGQQNSSVSHPGVITSTGTTVPKTVQFYDVGGMKPTNQKQQAKALGKYLEKRLGNYFPNRTNFDKNSAAAADKVRQMRLDSSKAVMVPAAMDEFTASLREFKKLERLSKQFSTWDKTKRSREMEEMRDTSQAYINKQVAIISKADAHFLKGQRILELAGSSDKMFDEAEQRFLDKHIFSKEELAKLEALEAEIKFATKQLNELLKAKSGLSDAQRTANSETLQLIGVLSNSMTETVKLVESYLVNFASERLPNKLISPADLVDISHTFFEKAIEESLQNGRPLEESLVIALSEGALKAAIALGSKKFPVDQLSILPLKFRDVKNSMDTWSQLDTRDLKQSINDQTKILDHWIDKYQRLIERNNKIIKESANFSKGNIKKQLNDYLNLGPLKPLH